MDPFTLIWIEVCFLGRVHAEKLPTRTDLSVTGGAYDFTKGTTSLTNELISSPKKVMLIRHGLSTWNAESRIQVCLLLSSY